MKPKPLLLSVGAMKAGTTWLYDKLRLHPQIFFTPEKELHYFAHRFGGGEPLREDRRKARAFKGIRKAAKADTFDVAARRTLQWYLDYVTGEIDAAWFSRLYARGSRGTKYVADFSNLTCLLTTEQWKALLSEYPKVRALYILRDPIKRVWSHYKFHLAHTGSAQAADLSGGLEHFQSLVQRPFFLKNALYSQNIATMKAVLNKRQLLVLYFEDMVARPAETLAQIEAFAGLDAFDYATVDLFEKKNTSREARMPEDYRAWVASRLSDEIRQLKAAGHWHDSWSAV